MATLELQGTVLTWHGLGYTLREYIVVNVTYGQARVAFKPDLFKAERGTGEQRGLLLSHVRTLKKAMEAGTFTPTTVSVGLRSWHAEAVVYTGEGATRQARLVVAEDDSLPQTDGGHRFGALEAGRRIAEDRLRLATKLGDVVAQGLARASIARVDAQPVSVVVHLNGNTQDDFINLQLGKAVDATHLFSLRVIRRRVGDKESDVLRLSFETARILNTTPGSPFYRQIRFDNNAHAAYPLSTLCPRGSSDLGTSLAGLARVGLAGARPLGPGALAYAVTAACTALREHAPELLEGSHVLTPPPDGSKGAATMLLGVGMALAARLEVAGLTEVDEAVTGQLVRAAQETLWASVGGNFSGPVKRAMLGDFVKVFFADAGVETHEGIPLSLVKTLSPSAFGVGRLPAGSRRKVTPPAAKPAAAAGTRKRPARKAAPPARKATKPAPPPGGGASRPPEGTR